MENATDPQPTPPTSAPVSSKSEPIEPIMLLLFGGMVFFTAVLIAVEVWFKSDGQVFQVVAGLLTGFSGAFFGRLKPAASPTETPAVQKQT